MADTDYNGLVQVVGKGRTNLKKCDLVWDDEKVAGRPELSYVLHAGTTEDSVTRFMVCETMRLTAVNLGPGERISFKQIVNCAGDEIDVMAWGSKLEARRELNPVFLPAGNYRACVSDPDMLGRVLLKKDEVENFNYDVWVGSIAGVQGGFNTK